MNRTDQETKMKLTLEMDMDNAAFTDSNGNGIEAARILRTVADRIRGAELGDGDELPLMDANGNRVGRAVVSE